MAHRSSTGHEPNEQTWEEAGGEQHGPDPELALMPRVEAAREEPSDERRERIAHDEGREDGPPGLKHAPGDGEEDDGQGQQRQLGASANTGCVGESGGRGGKREMIFCYFGDSSGSFRSGQVPKIFLTGSWWAIWITRDGMSQLFHTPQPAGRTRPTC